MEMEENFKNFHLIQIIISNINLKVVNLNIY